MAELVSQSIHRILWSFLDFHQNENTKFFLKKLKPHEPRENIPRLQSEKHESEKPEGMTVSLSWEMEGNSRDLNCQRLPRLVSIYFNLRLLRAGLLSDLLGKRKQLIYSRAFWSSALIPRLTVWGQTSPGEGLSSCLLLGIGLGGLCSGIWPVIVQKHRLETLVWINFQPFPCLIVYVYHQENFS